MKLPVYLYGHPVRRKVSEDITPDYPDLKTLLDNMYETMYASEGVGLAAPQIGRNDRIVVIDADPVAENFQPHEEEMSGFLARIVQHECDHLEGKLYIDHVSLIRKQLIRGKLNNIIEGKIRCDYQVRYAPKKKK